MRSSKRELTVCTKVSQTPKKKKKRERETYIKQKMKTNNSTLRGVCQEAVAYSLLLATIYIDSKK